VPHRWRHLWTPYQSQHAKVSIDYLFNRVHVSPTGAADYSISGSATGPAGALAGDQYFGHAAIRGDRNDGQVCLKIREAEGKDVRQVESRCIPLKTTWQQISGLEMTPSGPSGLTWQLEATGGGGFDVRHVGISHGGSDHTPPSVDVNLRPRARLGNPKDPTSAYFRFTSAEQMVSYLCAIDGAKLATCPKPLVVENLEPGKHTLVVVATDEVGNKQTFTHNWTVDLGVPNGSFARGVAGFERLGGGMVTAAKTTSGARFAHVEGLGMKSLPIHVKNGRYIATAWVSSKEPVRICIDTRPAAAKSKTGCVRTKLAWQQLSAPVEVKNGRVVVIVHGFGKVTFSVDSINLTRVQHA
jgi:hypothetical protein